MLFQIDHTNQTLYAAELQEVFALRHAVLCQEFKWTGLAPSDGLERDQYDDDRATYLCCRTTDGKVAACLRLNPTMLPNLTRDVFSHLVEFSDLPQGPEFVDVSRLVLSKAVRGEPYGAGLDLMCGMYEWGLVNRLRAYTAVVSVRVLHWLVTIGMRVIPMGYPQTIEGEATLAVYIPVTMMTLDNLYAKSRNPAPRLYSKSSYQRPDLQLVG